MTWKQTVLEFANKPREAHSIGYGAMLTYLGLYHQLTVPYTGLSLDKLALLIGVTIIGLKPKAMKESVNKALPKNATLPDDITKEEHYFWIGLTLIYVVQHLQGIVF